MLTILAYKFGLAIYSALTWALFMFIAFLCFRHVEKRSVETLAREDRDRDIARTRRYKRLVYACCVFCVGASFVAPEWFTGHDIGRAESVEPSVEEMERLYKVPMDPLSGEAPDAEAGDVQVPRRRFFLPGEDNPFNAPEKR